LYAYIHQVLRQNKVEEQHKHDKMLQDGRRIAELDYVDVDNKHTKKMDLIILQWRTLWEKCDEWFEAVSTKVNLKFGVKKEKVTWCSILSIAVKSDIIMSYN